MLKDKTTLINDLEMLYTLSEEEGEKLNGGQILNPSIDQIDRGLLNARQRGNTPFNFCGDFPGVGKGCDRFDAENASSLVMPENANPVNVHD